MEMIMSPQTMFSIMNNSEIDFDKFTLADAIGYAEFEEEVNSWEDVED